MVPSNQRNGKSAERMIFPDAQFLKASEAFA
jgi:hypothetical protein